MNFAPFCFGAGCSGKVVRATFFSGVASNTSQTAANGRLMATPDGAVCQPAWDTIHSSKGVGYLYRLEVCVLWPFVCSGEYQVFIWFWNNLHDPVRSRYIKPAPGTKRMPEVRRLAGAFLVCGAM